MTPQHFRFLIILFLLFFHRQQVTSDFHVIVKGFKYLRATLIIIFNQLKYVS